MRALALGSELAADVLLSAAQATPSGDTGADQLLFLSRQSQEHAQLYRGFERQLSRHRG